MVNTNFSSSPCSIFLNFKLLEMLNDGIFLKKRIDDNNKYNIFKKLSHLLKIKSQVIFDETETQKQSVSRVQLFVNWRGRFSCHLNRRGSSYGST